MLNVIHTVEAALVRMIGRVPVLSSKSLKLKRKTYITENTFTFWTRAAARTLVEQVRPELPALVVGLVDGQGLGRAHRAVRRLARTALRHSPRWAPVHIVRVRARKMEEVNGTPPLFQADS